MTDGFNHCQAPVTREVGVFTYVEGLCSIGAVSAICPLANECIMTTIGLEWDCLLHSLLLLLLLWQRMLTGGWKIVHVLALGLVTLPRHFAKRFPLSEWVWLER